MLRTKALFGKLILRGQKRVSEHRNSNQRDVVLVTEGLLPTKSLKGGWERGVVGEERGEGRKGGKVEGEVHLWRRAGSLDDF